MVSVFAILNIFVLVESRSGIFSMCMYHGTLWIYVQKNITNLTKEKSRVVKMDRYRYKNIHVEVRERVLDPDTTKTKLICVSEFHQVPRTRSLLCFGGGSTDTPPNIYEMLVYDERRASGYPGNNIRLKGFYIFTFSGISELVYVPP